MPRRDTDAVFMRVTCTADTPGAPPEIGNDEEEDEDMQLALRMSRGD